MPTRVTIENLHIEDGNRSEDYRGPTVFSNFNPAYRDDSYEWRFPYVITEEVILRNVTSKSGKPLRLGDNKHMFRDVVVR